MSIWIVLILPGGWSRTFHNFHLFRCQRLLCFSCRLSDKSSRLRTRQL